MRQLFFLRNEALSVCRIFAFHMKKIRLSYCVLMLAITQMLACTAYETPDSGIDCGRQFINATYQGNFKRAKQLLIPTEENILLLEEKIEKNFRNRNSFEKENLSNASITINHLESKGDTVQLIHFTNAYNSKPQILKCVLVQGEWKTDLSFSYRN